MRGLSTILTSLSLVFVAISLGYSTTDSPTTKATVIKNLTSMPLVFTKNYGQWDERVQFRADAGGATMWFTRDGVYYQFTRRVPRDNAEDDELVDPLHDQFGRERDSFETMMVKTAFIGANPNPRMFGEDVIEYKCNYFLGNDPNEWRTNVPSYRAVIYEDVYPGIDLKYYSNGQQMEYDFIVSPDADPEQIQIQYDGIRSLSVNQDGELVLETDWGAVTESKPVIYQLAMGTQLPCKGRYKLLGENTLGFELEDSYNKALSLVIDPVILSYSTYLGGNENDAGRGIVTDGNGNVFVVGYTRSSNFPVVNAFDSSHNAGYDVFVTKFFFPDGNLVYSTYLGGVASDFGEAICVDQNGCAYVTGNSSSTDFPMVNPIDSVMDIIVYYEAFVTKLAATGDSLIYSTFLGGNDRDYGYGIDVDNDGYTYVVGETRSLDFPLFAPLDSSFDGFNDAFVAKLSLSGNELVYSTYLGGSGEDYGWDVEVDATGRSVVTGETSSADFQTVDAYDSTLGDNYDAFVTIFSTSGDSLIYSTYLGGNAIDYGYGIALDNAGSIYVVGHTYSTDFPTLSAYDPNHNGGADIFVTKFSSSGTDLLYSTYLGGTEDDGGSTSRSAIAVDSSGKAHITGRTNSVDFPTVNAIDDSLGGSRDAFVARFSPSGSSLLFSTFLGGSDSDYGRSIAVDNLSNSYITGYTYSEDFPTVNPLLTDQELLDGFVSMISDTGLVNQPPIAYIDSIYPSPAIEGQTISFVGHGEDSDGSVTGFQWLSDIDGFLSADSSFWTSTLSAGIHTISFSVKDDSSVWSGPEEESLQVSTGLFAYWSFDDSTAIDNSEHGHDGTIYGAVPTEGISGSALWFDGNNDYVQLPNPVLNDPPYTICAWVKPESIADGQNHHIISNGGDTNVTVIIKLT